MGRIRRSVERFSLAMTATPICAEDCDCREHYLEDLGVRRCQNECCYVDPDTPGELFVEENEL